MHLSIRLKDLVKLSNLKTVRTNNNNNTLIRYYDHKDEEISYIYYNILNGEIKLFHINKNYTNKGLGKQILKNVINEMDINYNKEVWCVTGRNHDFWKNVFDKSFKYRIPIQPHLPNLHGYYMKL